MSTNGVSALDIEITDHGRWVYYAICAVMGVTAFTIMGLSFLKPREDRIFFYITAAINFTACIAYFTMGTELGWAAIDVEFPRPRGSEVYGVTREVFYARYVDWAITTPLLLMDLLLTAGMPWPTVLWVIFLDELMIVTGLIGALVRSAYKFGFFVAGCVAMFIIFYELAVTARAEAKTLGPDVHRCFMSCGVLTLFVWLLYPIAWGVAEGGNVITPDSEAAFYGVLDVIAKPVFSAALIFGHWNVSPSRLGLAIHYGKPVNSDAQAELKNHMGRGQTTGADA